MLAGAMHPPCRRKKLRPLRPRLTARTPLCSVPSSSPHAAGRAGAPAFLPEGKEKTGRARSTGRLLMALPFRAAASSLRGKEKRKYGPCGGTKDGGALSVPPFFYASFQPAAWCGRGVWWLLNGLPSLFAAADAPVNGPVLCVRCWRLAAYGGGVPLEGAWRPVSFPANGQESLFSPSSILPCLAS